MNEWTLVWLTIPRILILLVFVLCYVIGGRQWKPMRRIVGGIFLSASVILLSITLHSFRWWFLSSLAAYPIALSLGYGGNNTTTKFLRRLLYGSVLGAVSFIYGNIELAIYQTVIAVIASVWLGIRNPVPAVNEEALIALTSVSTVPFMV